MEIKRYGMFAKLELNPNGDWVNLADYRALEAMLDKERNGPLCADHAQAWFTARQVANELRSALNEVMNEIDAWATEKRYEASVMQAAEEALAKYDALEGKK